MFTNMKKALWLLTAGKPVGVKLSPSISDNWTLDADFILANTNKYSNDPIGRFAYNPKTRELVWGPMSQMHAIMIGNQASSPFDDFVRGVYTGSSIMLRWYSASTDPDEVKAENFDAWYSTKQMLENNGLPGGIDVTFGADTAAIRNEVGGWYK
jgi:hypothetical protein